MAFWGGSGSGDPCLWLMDPDPDPSTFSSLTSKMPAKNKFFNTIFSAYDFLKLHLHHFSNIKFQKESQNSRNQGFSYYFCMMIEGSGSGSIPLTSGSGSWRPKNTWIRIRIRNTASNWWIRIREAQRHVDPVDPDPQHWFWGEKDPLWGALEGVSPGNRDFFEPWNGYERSKCNLGPKKFSCEQKFLPGN